MEKTEGERFLGMLNQSDSRLYKVVSEEAKKKVEHALDGDTYQETQRRFAETFGLDEKYETFWMSSEGKPDLYLFLPPSKYDGLKDVTKTHPFLTIGFGDQSILYTLDEGRFLSKLISG